MAEFMAELYVSQADAAGAERVARRVRAATEQLTREGTSIRYLRAIFVPEDETCFVLCEAPSAGAVVAAAERASVRFARISGATEAIAEEA